MVLYQDKQGYGQMASVASNMRLLYLGYANSSSFSALTGGEAEC